MISNQNNNLLIIILIIIGIYILYNCISNNEKFKQLFNNNLNIHNNENKEKFSRIIPRPLNATKNNNKCSKPFTNSKRDTICSKDTYVNKFGNRMLMSPNEYNKMVERVLKDLQNKTEEYNLNNSNLIEEDFNGDQSLLINLLNNKLKKLSETKTYLHNNGAWKYEHFYVAEPVIFFYKLKKPNNVFLFKIMFTLQNPLRSSYTNSYAFILLDNKNKMNIIKAGIISEDSTKSEMFNNQNFVNSSDSIDKIINGKLDYTFVNVMPQLEFDEWGHNVNNSGIPYIKEVRQGNKVKIDAEIPDQFKDPNFNMQYLPPEFGNGICNYPPKYITPNGINSFLNNPPIY